MPFDRIRGDRGPDAVEDLPYAERDLEPVTGPRRDGVDGLDADEPPAIVSLSDVHGYVEAARSALLTLSDHPDYAPVVEAEEDGRLHWADENYVLVFNGDLVDRGPANEAVLDLVARLLAEAPPGRVRVTLGNHDAAILTPDCLGWDDWFSGRVGPAGRRTLVDAIRDGHVVAAYEGHGVTYAHAGLGEPYDAADVNDELVEAAATLRPTIGGADDGEATQRRLIDGYDRVFGWGEYSRGPNAGIAWRDFSHMPPDTPPQVVGHTRHDSVTRDGAVVCQNVIRANVGDGGGEAVLVETPDGLTALRRTADGGVEPSTV